MAGCLVWSGSLSLTAHETDTGERPFHCPHCKAGFHRADVRAKHMKKLHTPSASVSVSESSESFPQQRPHEGLRPRERERSRLACDQCRKRKLKCSNVRPCEACLSKQLPCTVSSTSRPPGRPRNRVPVSPGGQPIRENGGSVTDSGIPPVPQPWTPNSSGLEPPLDGPSLMTSIAGIDIPAVRDAAAAAQYPAATGLTPPPVMDEWMTSESASDFSIQGPFPGAANISADQICGDVSWMDDLLPQLVSDWICPHRRHHHV